MRDSNICPHCRQHNPLQATHCSYCCQALMLQSEGAITIWRLGSIREGLIGILARAVQDAFQRPCVIQPAYMNEGPSLRPEWAGISANVFLRQTLNRHRDKEIAVLAITENNMVPSASYNFLFGYAYMGLPAATASVHPLAWDDPPEALLAERLVKIALHELGHSFGLDHHSYEELVDCLVVGDEDVDSVEGIDSGNIRFCKTCASVIQKKLHLK